MKLIDDIRGEWKKASTRIATVATVLFGTLTAFPSLAIEAWNTLPQDMRSNIPYQQIIAFALFAGVLGAKFIKQKDKPDA